MRAEINTYNGWTNYETWVVKLWIDNDQGSQEYWLDRARQAWAQDELWKDLREAHEEANPVKDGSVFSDLMSAALASVNWDEIANALIEDSAYTEKTSLRASGDNP